MTMKLPSQTNAANGRTRSTRASQRSGTLQLWEGPGRIPVSAKDVILEMLRRHKTDGGKGRIIEYYRPGLTCLSAMDRHVIANMGAELGATTQSDQNG